MSYNKDKKSFYPLVSCVVGDVIGMEVLNFHPKKNKIYYNNSLVCSSLSCVVFAISYININKNPEIIEYLKRMKFMKSRIYQNMEIERKFVNSNRKKIFGIEDNEYDINLNILKSVQNENFLKTLPNSDNKKNTFKNVVINKNDTYSMTVDDYCILSASATNFNSKSSNSKFNSVNFNSDVSFFLDHYKDVLLSNSNGNEYLVNNILKTKSIIEENEEIKENVEGNINNNKEIHNKNAFFITNFEKNENHNNNMAIKIMNTDVEDIKQINSENKVKLKFNDDNLNEKKNKNNMTKNLTNKSNVGRNFLKSYKSQYINFTEDENQDKNEENVNSVNNINETDVKLISSKDSSKETNIKTISTFVNKNKKGGNKDYSCTILYENSSESSKTNKKSDKSHSNKEIKEENKKQEFNEHQQSNLNIDKKKSSPKSPKIKFKENLHNEVFGKFTSKELARHDDNVNVLKSKIIMDLDEDLKTKMEKTNILKLQNTIMFKEKLEKIKSEINLPNLSDKYINNTNIIIENEENLDLILNKRQSLMKLNMIRNDFNTGLFKKHKTEKSVDLSIDNSENDLDIQKTNTDLICDKINNVSKNKSKSKSKSKKRKKLDIKLNRKISSDKKFKLADKNTSTNRLHVLDTEKYFVDKYFLSDKNYEKFNNKKSLLTNIAVNNIDAENRDKNLFFKRKIYNCSINQTKDKPYIPFQYADAARLKSEAILSEINKKKIIKLKKDLIMLRAQKKFDTYNNGNNGINTFLTN